jgi:N-acyl-D-amino-acid deacylase
MRKNFVLLLLFFLLSGLFLISCSKPYDVVIIGGTIIDGTGSKGYQADIGIEKEIIETIGRIDPSEAQKVIDAKGKYVVPGFIDIHTHSDNIRDRRRKEALNYITQGVTTMVTGNCGSGTFKVAEFFSQLEEQGIGTNIVHLVGHGTIRRAVMKNADREPTREELERMKALVDQAMQEGAAGLSTGLFYAPGSYAKTEEIIELAKVVQKNGGFYASHIRDESDYTIGLKAAISEAIEIGEKSRVRIEISHLKALGRTVWGQAEEVCQIIESARKKGLTVCADQYPYSASSTALAAAVVPRWVQADGKMNERLRDTELLPQIKKEMEENIERRGGGETLVISSFPKKPEWEGKNLKEISAVMNLSEVDAAIELVLMGGPGIISFNMSDADVEYFMGKPYVMTCSDGSVVIFGKGKPHPRNYGTFPRKIRTYVLDKNVLSMEQAVRAATGLPAEMLGFKDRGLLKKDYFADIVIFDPARIQDRATFAAPHQYSEGIDNVLVNGKIVIREGEFTGTLAGKPLRK